MRACPSSAASGRLRSIGLPRRSLAVVGSAVRSSLQSIAAASARSITWAPRVRETFAPAQSATACRRARTPVISSGVHAEPGRERERSVDLTTARAHRGDRRAAADHRHDALVLVLERLRRPAREVRQQVLRGPLAALERHGAELRQGCPSGPGMLATSPIAYTRGKPFTVSSGCTSMRPPRPWGTPAAAASGRGRDASAPHHAAGRGSPCRRRGSRPAGSTSVTLVSRCSSTPLRVRTLDA